MYIFKKYIARYENSISKNVTQGWISVTFFLATILHSFLTDQVLSYCRKYFLCTKLLFTSFILLEFLRSTNLVMCTGMFFAMPTVQASPNLAEFLHKWNNFILPLQADTNIVWNGMTFMNCIKNVILHLNKEVHNLNNISIAILYSVFTVYFGSEICR